MQDIGDMLRIARVGKRLSQRKLALKGRVSQSTVSRLENGKRVQPQAARRIAHALGLPPGLLALDTVDDGAEDHGRRA